jgi:putative membrane protein
LEDLIVMIEKEKPQSPSTDEYKQVTKGPMDLRLLGALVRTGFSSEQSLMSWTRTSVSLITFGFSIAKFFYYLAEQQGGAQLSAGPRRLGLALIFVGILALVLAMVEHVHRLRVLQEQGLPKISRYLLPLGTALGLLAIGVVALISVYFNWSL